MLTQERIDDLINLRLSPQDMENELAALTPDRLGLADVRAFVDALRKTVVDNGISLNSFCGRGSESHQQELNATESYKAELDNFQSNRTELVSTEFARAVLEFPVTRPVLDCTGTGGSGLQHFNTSTTVAFVLASGGVRVAKCGNRKATGACGSFDFLDALGVGAEISDSQIPRLLDEVGLVFMFAPKYYPALARLGAVRRRLKIPTIFNAIGPLLHPLKPEYRLMGTGDANVQRVAAQFLSSDGSTMRAMVVRSDNGLDELDPATKNHLIEATPGGVVESTLAERKIELPPGIGTMEMTAERNFAIFNALLDGTCHPYFTELVCLNAGFGFKVWGTVPNLEQGEDLARELIRSGAVKSKYEELRRAYADLAD